MTATINVSSALNVVSAHWGVFASLGLALFAVEIVTWGMAVLNRTVAERMAHKRRVDAIEAIGADMRARGFFDEHEEPDSSWELTDEEIGSEDQWADTVPGDVVDAAERYVDRDDVSREG